MNGVDYNFLSGRVTISAGLTSATITVSPVDDVAFEGNEIVSAVLIPSSGYAVGTPSAGAITIIDNESAGVTISGSPSTVVRGSPLTVSWSGIVTPTARDWIGLYAPGAPNTALLAWEYVSCDTVPATAKASGSCPFPIPASLPVGAYELRLFANDGFGLIAASGITVADNVSAATIQYLSGSAKGSPNAQTVDFDSLDTTGATFGALCTASFGNLTLEDSRGGTWTEQRVQGPGSEVRFWTRSGGSFGPNTTVRITNNGTKYPSGVIAFYKGVSTPGAPVSANAAGTTLQPGSVTPGGANSLLLTCLAMGNPHGEVSINSNYQIRGVIGYQDGIRTGIALADLIQIGTATAQAPIWTSAQLIDLRATHAAVLP